MRELTFVRHGRLEWRDRRDPVLEADTDATAPAAGRPEGLASSSTSDHDV